MAIKVTHSKVSTIPDGDDSSLIRPSDWNSDHTLVGLGTMAEQNANSVAITGGTISGVAVTGYVPTTETITAGTGLTGGGDLSANRTIALANTAVTTGTYGNAARTITQTVDQQGRLTNIFDQPIAIANTQVSGLGTASTKDAGVALGVATLDSAGKVPLTQIPDSIIGALNYQGTWNASTNTPTLTSSVGTKGYYYVVSVAGTTNLNGITDWQIGDWAVYNGTAWQKIDNTDGVTSVNGYTGAVVLTQSDISGTVPTSRTITAGTGLSGGGDLSANRTLAIANTGVTAATYGSASSVPVVAVNAQGQVTSATNTTIAIANTQVSGLGTMSTQNANSVTITGGSLNGTNIGGSVAGDGTFDILTANVSRLGTSTATSYVASNGLSSTSTFTGSAPTDGIVVDYSTGYGRFSAFTGDGYQWYTGGIGTTKIMDLSSSGALVTNGTVTANGVVLTGNTGTVTSITAGTGLSGGTITTSGTVALANTAVSAGSYTNASLTVDAQGRLTAASSGTAPVTSVAATSPVVSSGGTTPTISMAAANTTTNGYLTSTDWNTFNNKQPAGSYLTSVTADAPLSGSGTSASHLSIPAATTSVNGYLTSTDWNTFNGKAPAVTYTTNYIPFGQGTTTPNQSANLQWDGSTMRVGSAALLGGTTNPIVGITGGSSNYIQGYIYNSTNGASSSADLVAYPNNGTDAHGWVDMGITSQTYADATYTVTGPNEAYLFGSAPSGAGKTGNLVYATDSTGSANAHQFYVGGFTQAKSAWKAQIDTNGLSATQLNATNGIIVNSKTVSASYSIPSGSSAMSTGPMTVASGQTVTVASGSRWVIL
jgi:hypothetical protein